MDSMTNKEEYTKDVHQQVLQWTGNCDTKASIILALVGVLIPLIFSSEYILTTIQNILKSVHIYHTKHIGQFDLLSLLIVLLFIACITLLCISLFYLLRTITAKLKDKTEFAPSIIFFNSIGKLTRDEYKNKVNATRDEELINDRLEQIHICSEICSIKFNRYNKGIHSLMIGLCFLVVLIVLVTFFKTIV